MLVFVCALAETVPAHSFVRNRKSERCELANQRDRVVRDIFSKNGVTMKNSRLLTELPGEGTNNNFALYTRHLTIVKQYSMVASCSPV